MCQTALWTPKVLRGNPVSFVSQGPLQENKGYESLRRQLRSHIGFDASDERAFLPAITDHRDQLRPFQ